MARGAIWVMPAVRVNYTKLSEVRLLPCHDPGSQGGDPPEVILLVLEGEFSSAYSSLKLF